MTQIKETTRLFTYTVFLLACLTTAAFSDSFVNEDAMNFQYGTSFAATDTMVTPATYGALGDSFVNEATREALKDFRFGTTPDTTITADADTQKTAETTVEAGDSFVNMEALNSYDDQFKDTLIFR